MLRVIRSLHRLIGGRREQKLWAPALFFRRPLRSVLKVLPWAVLCTLPFSRPALCQHWQRLGPPGGMVISLAAASDGTVYLGTPDGHVFASRDRGGHWELRGRAADRLDAVVQRMVVDTRNPNRMLAAVWFRDSRAGGVFESADGAKTWKLAGLGNEAVRALEQSASDAAVWMAGTRSGVFRSTDDARSWQRITPAEDPELQNIDSLAIDPRDAQTVYVGTYHLPWKTTDGGKNWHSISAGMIDDSDVMSLRIDAQNPQRIFSSACSGIYRSEDGGASWTKLAGIPYSSRRTQQIVQDPGDAQTLYAATTEGLWMTSDSGETWKRVTTRDTDANAAVVLAAREGPILLAGTSAQGILRSENGGTALVESNGGFAHRVVTAAAKATVGREVLIQTEGGPAPEYSGDGGTTWTPMPAANPRKPIRKIFFASGTWWAAFFDGGVAEFNSRLQRWRDVPFREVKTPARRRAITLLAKPSVNFLVASGGGLVATSRDALWILDEKKREFRKAPTTGLPFPVAYLSLGRDGSLLAIAAGELWSSQGKSVWKRLEPPARAAGLLWIRGGSGANPEMLLGTLGGVFAREKNAWRLLSKGLPSIPSTAAACAESHCLVAMSNGGLYRSEESLETWQRVDSDGERGKVSEILVEENGTFLVGSEQEGMLRFVSRE
jgi:photosystem II stability/assembly factor-like uncharacterized protein